jgi:hypothetical protein
MHGSLVCAHDDAVPAARKCRPPSHLVQKHWFVQGMIRDSCWIGVKFLVGVIVGLKW